MVRERQPINIQLPPGKKVYFASDQHFGAPNAQASRTREKIFLDWLEKIEPDCGVLFLLGDLFDFWIEYKEIVPRGFVRVLGKLASFCDAGIAIHFFTGNHDMWMLDYFEKEIGAKVYREKHYFTIDEKLFLIAHGDGLGPNDKGYKRMKKLFQNPLAQWLFRFFLHPDWAVQISSYVSRRNKLISGEEDIHFLGEDKEWLAQYCRRKLETQEIDYFLFGHRHLPMHLPIGEAFYINTGDWIDYYTYAVWDGNSLELKEWLTGNTVAPK